jgi:hypothetical protein
MKMKETVRQSCLCSSPRLETILDIERNPWSVGCGRPVRNSKDLGDFDLIVTEFGFLNHLSSDHYKETLDCAQILWK